MEPSFLPNCISDPTEIPPFESPTNPFVHRERGDPRPRHLPRQKLVRRNPNTASAVAIAIAVNIVVIVVVAVTSTPAISVLVPEDLRPVRNVDRERRRSRADAIAGIGDRSLRGRLLGDQARGRDRFAELGRVGSGRVVEVGLVEFECGGVYCCCCC